MGRDKIRGKVKGGVLAPPLQFCCAPCNGATPELLRRRGATFRAALHIGGKALDKIFPDRAKLQEKNLEINAETERASGGRMTPRKLMMYLLCVLFAWEAVARPILITYWPNLTLPPSMGKEIWLAVSALFGMGF